MIFWNSQFRYIPCSWYIPCFRYIPCSRQLPGASCSNISVNEKEKIRYKSIKFRCYVGSSEDQWRPCSEKYYPYLPSPRPIRPLIGGNDPDRHDRPDYRSDPGYSRHWPITYLHRESPPNCTDSLASADNSEARRSNETTPVTMVIKGDKNDTAIANGARRRRLRVRTIANDRRASLSRKIGARIAVNEVAQNQTNRERAAKIERVSKPMSTVASIAAPIVAPPAAGNASDGGARFKDTRSDDGMLQLALITPNNSLPAPGA